MANKELVMLDEGLEEDRNDKSIAVVFSDNCMLNGNVLTIPLSEALSVAANIIVQASMLI